MTQRIVYQLLGEAASIMAPCACGLTIKQIGEKDVPPGVPFWIISHEDIPVDRSLRSSWELDVEALGAPAGVGGSYKPEDAA